MAEAKLTKDRKIIRNLMKQILCIDANGDPFYVVLDCDYCGHLSGLTADEFLKFKDKEQTRTGSV
jgi:hypothetical protein